MNAHTSRSFVLASFGLALLASVIIVSPADASQSVPSAPPSELQQSTLTSATPQPEVTTQARVNDAREATAAPRRLSPLVGKSSEAWRSVSVVRTRKHH